MMRSLLLIVPVVLTAGAAGAAPRTWVIDPAASAVRVHVGKAGLLRFAGHEHEVVATRLSGTIDGDPDALAAGRVTVEIDAAGLRVDAAREPSGDAPKVQETMAGPRVLDVTRFAVIRFTSRSVAGRPAGPDTYDMRVTGDLTLHGMTRALTVPVKVALAANELVATGELAVRQRDFGMTPVSAGAGTVKVRDEVAIVFRLVARPRP